VLFTMLVIFHYYVDGLIWRFREYPELRALLPARPVSSSGACGGPSDAIRTPTGLSPGDIE